jgi:hypothetical protein
MVCLRVVSIAASLALAWSAQAVAQAAPAQPARALTADDLDQISGGQEITTSVLSNQQLTAANAGNSVNAASVRSGDVTFSGGALANFSGVGNFVVNTGNNNNLQGAISLSIISAPPVR